MMTRWSFYKDWSVFSVFLRRHGGRAGVVESRPERKMAVRMRLVSLNLQARLKVDAHKAHTPSLPFRVATIPYPNHTLHDTQ